jgi:AcrR family transcriptional regulator
MIPSRKSNILVGVSPSPSYAERRKLQLRDEIIDAAFDVFAERGYHDAGVADIAERVGIGSSTFYRHFETKRDLLDAVITTVIDRWVAVLDAENAAEAAATIADYRAQSQRIAVGLNDIATDFRIIRILLGQITGVDREFEQKIFAMFDLAVAYEAGYLENGLKRGYLQADIDTVATARAVVGMIFGTVIMGLSPNIDAEQRSKTSQAAVQLMFDGIAK